MNALYAFFGVAALFVIVYLGVDVLGLQSLFGVVLPYAAIFLFLTGFVFRILQWAKSPVPFRIPTTTGQQRSLDWLPSQPLENPSGGFGAVLRMAMEVLLFRSLFRNTRAELNPAREKVSYVDAKYLWGAAMAFH